MKDLLIEQENALHQYETRHNKREIIRLIHPEFKEVGQSGNSFSFQSIIEMMSLEKPPNGKVHAQEYECIQLEYSVYLVLYKTAWISQDGSASYFAKRSSIWVLNNGVWQVKYHQCTPCDEFKITSVLSH